MAWWQACDLVTITLVACGGMPLGDMRSVTLAVCALGVFDRSGPRKAAKSAAEIKYAGKDRLRMTLVRISYAGLRAGTREREPWNSASTHAVSF